MKKQILITAFFLLALMAGTLTSIAQPYAVTWSAQELSTVNQMLYIQLPEYNTPMKQGLLTQQEPAHGVFGLRKTPILLQTTQELQYSIQEPHSMSPQENYLTPLMTTTSKLEYPIQMRIRMVRLNLPGPQLF